MNKQTILIYGVDKTSKSEFIKKVSGIEINQLPEFAKTPVSFPAIYVSDIKPENDDMLLFDVILEFTENKEVFFIKGFSLETNVVNSQLNGN